MTRLIIRDEIQRPIGPSVLRDVSGSRTRLLLPPSLVRTSSNWRHVRDSRSRRSPPKAIKDPFSVFSIREAA